MWSVGFLYQKVLSEQEWKREAMEIEMLEEEGDFETRCTLYPLSWDGMGGGLQLGCMTQKLTMMVIRMTTFWH